MTFGKKLFAGFAVSALILVIVGVSGYRNTQALIESERWVTHTQQVRRDLLGVLSGIKDAETGQRGFLITGVEAYLEPYNAGTQNVLRAYDELRKQVSDNATQTRRLDQLRPLIDAKLSELKATIDLRRSQGFEAAQKVVALGEGKRAMDDARRLIAEIDREEVETLERRREESNANSASAKAVILYGSILGVLFVIMVGLFMARSLGAQVGTAVRHIRSSSTELQTAANQQATASKEQATAMSEITTTINELLATSRQIADSSQRVAQIAQQTHGAARSGDTTVLKASDAIISTKRQVDVVVSHMLELGKKSQQIGSVLDIVSELSEQTNILAINATIEAAGAGEAGRRFAVVAEEIRGLADRVAGSTKEIRGLIDDVRSAVNATVMVTETTAKGVDAGARQFSEVQSALKDIVGLVDTTTSAAREIELSTKQQATAVEQVNIAIANVVQASRESETSSTQTLHTSRQLATLSSELLAIVEATPVG